MDSQTHYDYEDGTVATTVLRPFMTAGREFQWGDGCVPGIGIDKEAYEKALKEYSRAYWSKEQICGLTPNSS